MTQPRPPDPRPNVRNGISNGTVNGQAVQSGSVYGGVHYYNVNVPAPQPVMPVYVPYVVPPAPVRRRAGAGAFIGKWVVALLPLMLVAAAIGGIAEKVTAGQDLGVRLLVVVAMLALGMTVIAVWALVARRGVADLLGLVLDKATSRHLAALSTSTLVVLIGFLSAFWLFGLVKELSTAPGDPKSAGATGALVFLAFLAVLVGRLIAQRRGIR